MGGGRASNDGMGKEKLEKKDADGARTTKGPGKRQLPSISEVGKPGITWGNMSSRQPKGVGGKGGTKHHECGARTRYQRRL